MVFSPGPPPHMQAVTPDLALPEQHRWEPAGTDCPWPETTKPLVKRNKNLQQHLMAAGTYHRESDPDKEHGPST